uniref:Uncharacterized protein n=1 Tax=Lotus japonicus TaxID=34305 RepID=I3S245_LOTJA|nr:unknown [Lotus japonicus]
MMYENILKPHKLPHSKELVLVFVNLHEMNGRRTRYSSSSLCAMCFTLIKLFHFFFNASCLTPFLLHSSLSFFLLLL